jgi:hypothetical protein
MVSWNRWASWVTTPTVAAREDSVASRTSIPFTRTAPSRTSYRRGTRLEMVVLPAPEGPTRATRDPGSTVKLTSSRTWWGLAGVTSGTATDSREARETSSGRG